MQQIIKVLGKKYILTSGGKLTKEQINQVVTRIKSAGGDLSKLKVLAYTDQCTGNPEVAYNNTSTVLGTYGEVQKGRVWAQKFSANFRCLDSVQFYVMRDANVNFYIEIRRDDAGKPKGKPLVNDAGLVMRTSSISYTELPTSWAWRLFTVGAILDEAAASYWICLVPVDYYDSPVYRDIAYDRFRIADGNNLAAVPSSVYINGSWGNSSSYAFAVYKNPTFIPACIPVWKCELPLNGYESDGCGNRRLNAACNPTCTPNWQCEQPLNGYESDGCGNRRLNAACNPTCTPNWQCEQPLNGYESDGCGNRKINTICNPGGGCIPNWQCEQPLNGYESDGCGNRRTNTGCNPTEAPPPGPGSGTMIGIGLLGAGILGLAIYASRKR